MANTITHRFFPMLLKYQTIYTNSLMDFESTCHHRNNPPINFHEVIGLRCQGNRCTIGISRF